MGIGRTLGKDYLDFGLQVIITKKKFQEIDPLFTIIFQYPVLNMR